MDQETEAPLDDLESAQDDDADDVLVARSGSSGGSIGGSIAGSHVT